MRNRRALLFLLMSLAVLSVAHIALHSFDRNRGKAVADRRTLLDVSRSFTRISIVRKGVPETVLVASPAWRLASPYAGSANEPTVKRLLDVLSMTPADDVLTDAELLRHGRTRSDFQLDDPELVVTLSDAVGSERIEFGARTAAGTCVYATVAGTDSVFAVPTNVLSAIGASALDFRRRSLFMSVDADIASFQIRRASGRPLAFVREGEGWRTGNAQASEKKIRPFLDRLQSAEAVEFVWPTGATNEAESVSAALLSAYGLEAETAVTVSLRGVNGEDDRVSFGGDVKDSLCYALVQNGGAIVTVPAELRQAAANGEAEFTDARLFPYEPPNVTTFTLSSDGVDYIVAREAAGGWRLDAPVSAPADGEIVSSVLDRILVLSAADLRPQGVSVSISTNGEPATVSVESVLGAARLDDLRSRAVVTVDPALVKRLVQTVGDSAFPDSVLYDRERNMWIVEKSGRSGAVDADAVSSLIAALNPLEAVRIERLKVDVSDLARYGLDHPSGSVAIDTDQANAVRRNILIGRRVGSGNDRYATVGSSDAVFVLPEAAVRVLGRPLVSE